MKISTFRQTDSRTGATKLYLIHYRRAPKDRYKLIDPSTFDSTNKDEQSFEEATPAFMGNITAEFTELEDLITYLNTNKIDLLGTVTIDRY